MVLLQRIKAFIPAGEASPAPPLGPLLGQYQVNISDFVPKFNAQSSSFEKGVPLAVIVNRNPRTKSYKIEIKGPTAMSMFDVVTKVGRSGRECIPIESLYDIGLIQHKLFVARGINLPLPSVIKSLFSLVYSAKIPLYIPRAFFRTRILKK